MWIRWPVCHVCCCKSSNSFDTGCWAVSTEAFRSSGIGVSNPSNEPLPSAWTSSFFLTYSPICMCMEINFSSESCLLLYWFLIEDRIRFWRASVRTSAWSDFGLKRDIVRNQICQHTCLGIVLHAIEVLWQRFYDREVVWLSYWQSSLHVSVFLRYISYDSTPFPLGITHQFEHNLSR